MNAPASITVTPVQVADLLAEGQLMPVYVHVIDHPEARVLVDTGMTELHPAVFGELDEPHTEGQQRVRALDPELVWLAHEHEPWRLHTV